MLNQNFQSPPLQTVSSWASPNPNLSMDTVTVYQGAVGIVQRPARQQQVNLSHRPDGSENNGLPELSMRDLQFLDTSQSQLLNQAESQPLYHLQHQRDVLMTENRVQNQATNPNQGQQTLWSSFSSHNPVQSGGAVPGGGGGGGGTQCLGFNFLDGMEGDEILKGLAGGSQTGFQLKQEAQMSVGQDAMMHSPRENQSTTYTNLISSRSVSNGPLEQMRLESTSQPLKHLHNPYSSSSSAAHDASFANLAEWFKADRQSDYKE